VYFNELSKQYSPATLWTIFSCLNKNFQLSKNIRLNDYSTLVFFLKQKSEMCKPKKAVIFSSDQIKQYLSSAPNEGEYLVNKLVLVFGLFGALRCNELTVLEWEDVLDETSQGVLRVTIRHSKTDKAGKGFEFVIPSNPEYPEICPIRLFHLYKSFVSIPTGTKFRITLICLSIEKYDFLQAAFGKHIEIIGLSTFLLEGIRLEGFLDELHAFFNFQTQMNSLATASGAHQRHFSQIVACHC
jgi:integrase